MPYIIVRGNLASYDHKYPWRVLVSGLKASDMEQLTRFSCGGYTDDNTLVYLQHPCVILSALEVLGYQIVASSSTSVKQDYNEYVWTMRKDFAVLESEFVLKAGDWKCLDIPAHFQISKDLFLYNLSLKIYFRRPLTVNALAETGYRVFFLFQCRQQICLEATKGSLIFLEEHSEKYVGNKMAKEQGHGHEHGHEKEIDSCCSSYSDLGVRQSLYELEFERGIWYAAQYNDRDKVERLLRKGVSSDAEDSAGYTALHYAARNGHYRICEILLEYGANVNATTRCGRATALHRAATQGHDRVVETLLDHGADANLKDADGCTALHRALLAARSSISRTLIPHSDLTILDNKNRNAKELAEEYCNDLVSLVSSYRQQIDEH